MENAKGRKHIIQALSLPRWKQCTNYVRTLCSFWPPLSALTIFHSLPTLLLVVVIYIYIYTIFRTERRELITLQSPEFSRKPTTFHRRHESPIRPKLTLEPEKVEFKFLADRDVQNKSYETIKINRV